MSLRQCMLLVVAGIAGLDGVYAIRMHTSRTPEPLLRPGSRAAQTVAQLESRSWALPIPKYTPEFEEEHGCLRDASPSWNFLSSSKWLTSRGKVELGHAVQAATENFTKTAFISMFEAAHNKEKASDADWLLETFACHAKRSGIRPLLFVMDQETQRMVNAHPPLLGVFAPELITGAQQFFDVENMDVYLLKWPGALAVMSMGAPSVFVSDVDVIWLQDPRKHLTSFGEVDAMVALDSQEDNLNNPDNMDRKDFWQEKAGAWAEGDHVPICCRGAFPFNAGQVYFTAKASTKQLLAQIIGLHALRVKNTSSHSGCHEDQDPMQWALYSHCAASSSRCKLLDPRLFMDFSLGKLYRNQSRGASVPYTIHFDTSYKRQVMTEQMTDIVDGCLDHNSV